MGLDITLAQQFVPVLDSIWQKVAVWSTARLSLVRWALVVNQVILATNWNVASCWCFSRSYVMQLKRLVWNFLWLGLDGTRDIRARAAWQIVILL